jgi:hypothetical protein
MAVRVFCDNPSELLKRIKDSIREGTVETWSVDSAGDFTHVPDQWRARAWFRPVLYEDRLVLNIIGIKLKRMNKSVYGVYHGRFIEMLLTHFDNGFDRVTATAFPESGDRLGGSLERKSGE